MTDFIDTKDDHPVFDPNHHPIETPAISSLQSDLQRWLWTGVTGGTIIGDPRMGKTIALRSLISRFYTRNNMLIPVYYISIPRRDQKTILSVFKQLCLNVGLRVTQRDRADDLADRYVHHISDKAIEQNCKVAMLIVDEMQRLKPLQFDAFAEVYDKLLLLGITLTVVFAGNDQESQNLLEIIDQPDYAHIRGRFFIHSISFKGLTSKEQVEKCLQQYDERRSPEDGPTYTEFFLPKEFNRGWRLAELSGDIWRVFSEYRKNYKLGSWGMQFFIVTINTLLVDFLHQYGVDKYEDDMLHECIRLSGLVTSKVKAN